ncbi:hypothetical protein GO755_10545 [Spirosoma sp. HMF4905]|uniref:Uncharacterized protein n=1 Tax=Spirosoma arboris TaxID=2682092 RepID=A0A7K1S9F8_9BACT|nr:hypothetical protein [Spirosoma arboris]MVM30473.1 hypothetical protein [Spirosoma arboris]
MKRPNYSLPKTIDFLSCLSDAKPTLATLKNRGKTYDSLIDEVLAFPDPDSEEKPPKLKVLESKLKISPPTLKKWTQELYTDFIALIESESAVMSFQTTRVCFRAKGRYEDTFLCFYCRIPHIPRVGEQVTIPFIYPTTAEANFYVEYIEHSYKDNEVEIIIGLTTIRPFFTRLIERARNEGRLLWDEYQKMSEVELEEFLRKEYRMFKRDW